jgi:hypothetical protein
MIALQLAGVMVGIVAVFEPHQAIVGLLGFLATVAAAAVVWHPTRDLETLAEAYSIASHELSLVKERIPMPHSEGDWTEFVRDAEQAIPREHTLWRARRSRPIAFYPGARPRATGLDGFGPNMKAISGSVAGKRVSRMPECAICARSMFPSSLASQAELRP